MAKKTAIASAQISIGKISLTLRYPALAPAEAKKDMTIQMAVWLAASAIAAANSR